MQQDQPDHTPWYQPRTAEIIQRGGEGMANSIGQGLQQFGQGIAKGIYERQARKQKEEEDAKETKKQHNYYMGIGEMMGFDKTAMQNAGAEGTKGMVEGTIAKQKFEEFAGRIREQKLKEAATARDASAVAQFQRSATNMTTPMQIPPGTFGPLYRGETIGGPISSEDRFNLMQKSGVNPDDQYKLMRAYGEMGNQTPMQIPAGARATGGTIGPNGVSTTFTTGTDRQSEQPTQIFLKDGSPTQKAMYSDGTIIDLPTDRAKSLTDAQANALQYSERMSFNNGVLAKLESEGFDATGAGAAAQKWTPNVLTGEKFQSYDAARKNWISAVLRKESGAAISKSEEKGAMEQYFPAFGDALSVVKQKAELRSLAEKNMTRAIGGIDNQPGTSAGKTIARFDSEADARAAGVGTNVFEMYDPQSASYRKALLK